MRDLRRAARTPARKASAMTLLFVNCYEVTCVKRKIKSIPP